MLIGLHFVIVKSIMVAENNSSLPGVAREMTREGHIMISYQWSHQKTLLMIREELVRNGFKV